MKITEITYKEDVPVEDFSPQSMPVVTLSLLFRCDGVPCGVQAKIPKTKWLSLPSGFKSFKAGEIEALYARMGILAYRMSEGLPIDDV